MACFVRYAFNFDNDSLILSNYLFFAAHPILQFSQKLAEGFSGAEVILGESYQIPIHYQIPERSLVEIMEIFRNDL